MKTPVLILLLPGILFAQREADPEEGMRLFRADCAVCHGHQGNSGGGGIGLLQGKFKRPSSDADILRYIRNGIPETAMEKVKVTDQQAGDIIAYMRASAKSQFATEVTGDAARGKAIFEGKGACITCHAVRGNGSHFGPDLTDIGAARPPAQLERSIVDPDAEILPQNRIVRITPRNGQPILGRQLNQDTFTIQIIDAKQQLQTFERSTLREVAVVAKSPMPSSKGKLTAAEVADLVAYLANLKVNTKGTKP
jgi:cytochrome c oxidase cbb3-type subunit 3